MQLESPTPRCTTFFGDLAWAEGWLRAICTTAITALNTTTNKISARARRAVLEGPFRAFAPCAGTLGDPPVGRVWARETDTGRFFTPWRVDETNAETLACPVTTSSAGACLRLGLSDHDDECSKETTRSEHGAEQTPPGDLGQLTLLDG